MKNGEIKGLFQCSVYEEGKLNNFDKITEILQLLIGQKPIVYRTGKAIVIP